MEQTTCNIQTALAAGSASVQPVTAHGGLPYLVVPEDYSIHDLESLLSTPTRKRADITITDTKTASFTTQRSTVPRTSPPSTRTSTLRPAAST